MAQIQAYAAGTIRVNPSTGRECVIDTAILQALKTVTVDKGFSIRVSSLNRYCEGVLTGSGEDSYHWRNGGGHAVDIDRVNGVLATGGTSNDIALIWAMHAALPTPAGVGQINCRPYIAGLNGWAQFNDSCNHNHFEYRGGAITLPGGGDAYVKFDINGDVKADLLAIRNDGYLFEYFGDGAGGTMLTYQAGPGWATTAALVPGDFDGDGAGDFMQTRTDGGLYFYKGNFASNFTPTYLGPGWASYSLLTGGVDFNSDGRADLIARGPDSNLYLYPGNGQGSFGNPVQIGTSWSSFTALVAGDFNKDGRGDIIARNSAGELWGYYGTANGFGFIQQVGQGWNGFTNIVSNGDHNGDSNPDLIARRGSDQTLWLYPGNGTGGFGSGVQIGSGWGAFQLIS